MSKELASKHDFKEVLQLIEAARGRAYQSVNATLIELYWHVGAYISAKLELPNGEVAWSMSWPDILQLSSRILRGLPGPWMLVDRGYADNSGAATLRDTDTPRPGRAWLNIDGNPQPTTCKNVEREPIQGVFSGLDTLLAVRTAQADLAVKRYEEASRMDDVKMAPDLEEAFRSTIEEHGKRCQRIQELRSAPLGWYLTPVTVGDQRLGRLQAVNKACEQLKPLCGK